jgi:hypothetical protein
LPWCLTHSDLALAASGRCPEVGHGPSQTRRLYLSSPSKGRAPIQHVMFDPSPVGSPGSYDLCRLLPPRAAASRAGSTPVAQSSFGAGRQTSQGKKRDLRAIYPSHLRQHPPGDIGLQALRLTRPSADASYALPDRRAGTLLTASFRSKVAPGTLACSASGFRHRGPQRTFTSKS